MQLHSSILKTKYLYFGIPGGITKKVPEYLFLIINLPT